MAFLRDLTGFPVVESAALINTANFGALK